MRKEKPLPKEGSFKEFATNRNSNANSSTPSKNKKPGISPKIKKMFNDRNDKPDRRQSRGNSFKEDRRSSSAGNREMFDAVCSKCGKSCKVPFKPVSGKPVSCSDCFKPASRDGRAFVPRRDGFKSSNRDGGSSRPQRDSNQRFARTNSGERELFDAVCMKCGNKCKVPFKPINGKGVSCSNCFVKNEKPGRGRNDSSRGNSFRGRR